MTRDVRIADLHVRVPGLSVHDARTLGEQIASRAAANLSDSGTARDIREVRLRVAAPIRSRCDSLIGLVAKAIAEELR